MSLIRKVPDGGWGWMVVFGAALANMVNQALVSVFGLLYGEEIMKTSYGIAGIALVMNINGMVTNFSGFITGPLLKNYSPRTVTFVGVLLTSSGLIFSSYATSLLHFIITYSVFTGLGLGLIMPATFMAVNSYFDQRKSQAVGLAMAGTGIGQTVMPQVVNFLLDKYEYRGATLIIGAITLHGLLGALLFQPVEWHLKPVGDEESESVALLTKVQTEDTESRIENSQETQTKCSKKEVVGRDREIDEKAENFRYVLAHLAISANHVQREHTNPVIVIITLCAAILIRHPHPLNVEYNTLNMIFRRIASALDLELLKDPIFVHIIIGLSIVYTSSIAFTMLFPFHLQSIGLTRAQAALSMSSLSAADISARLTIPRMARRLRLGNRITFLYGALMLALCRSLLTLQTTLETVLVASVLCGYVRAATVINQNLTVSEYCDETKLPAALGLNMVAKGLVVLTLGQFFGWIRDYTESYIVCIYVQSVCLLLVVCTWGTEMLHRKLTSPRTS